MISTPVIDTLSQNYSFFEESKFDLVGRCSDVDQVINLFINGTESVDHSFIYRAGNGGNFTIQDIPLNTGANTLEVRGIELTEIPTALSNQITVTASDRKNYQGTNIRLSDIAQSFQERLKDDSEFLSWCTANLPSGNAPRIYLGVDEKRYPETSKVGEYVVIFPGKSTKGQTVDDKDYILTIAWVVSDKTKQQDGRGIGFRGLSIIDLFGNEIYEAVKRETNSRGHALDEANDDIDLQEFYPDFDAVMQVSINFPTILGGYRHEWKKI
jgi:hypothetical protein